LLGLTKPLVRYACSGLRQDPDGTIHRHNRVIAKIAHPMVARNFLQPAPESLLGPLVDRGELTANEAQSARIVPVVEDIKVESDSGGHTDNRPLGSLFPMSVGLRDEIASERSSPRPIRVGAAGGPGTPASVTSAFTLGAGYVLTGSVNQACAESDLSERGGAMLAEADLSDVVMGPAIKRKHPETCLRSGAKFAPIRGLLTTVAFFA
jgi:PfaD family protein